jgi:hypothetical protein
VEASASPNFVTAKNNLRWNRCVSGPAVAQVNSGRRLYKDAKGVTIIIYYLDSM